MSKPPAPLFCENAEEKLGQFLREKREEWEGRSVVSNDRADHPAHEEVKPVEHYLNLESERLNKMMGHEIPSDDDPVNHPKHYTAHPSGVECIEIAEHMSYSLGNAIKYIWRAGSKGKQVEDLKKAEYYIRREISRIERANANAVKNQTY